MDGLAQEFGKEFSLEGRPAKISAGEKAIKGGVVLEQVIDIIRAGGVGGLRHEGPLGGRFGAFGAGTPADEEQEKHLHNQEALDERLPLHESLLEK